MQNSIFPILKDAAGPGVCFKAFSMLSHLIWGGFPGPSWPTGGRYNAEFGFYKTSTTADAKFSRFAAKTFLSTSAVVAYRELTLRYFPVGLPEGIQGISCLFIFHEINS